MDELNPAGGNGTLLSPYRPRTPPVAWFAKPNRETLAWYDSTSVGSDRFNIAVREDGFVMCRLARRGDAHVGYTTRVQEPPAEQRSYNHFNSLVDQLTPNGMIRTGRLALDIGHATEATSVADIRAHFDGTGFYGAGDGPAGKKGRYQVQGHTMRTSDNISTQAANVRMYVLDDGRVCAVGCLSPYASDLVVDAMRGTTMSGEWVVLEGASHLQLLGLVCVMSSGFIPMATRASKPTQRLRSSADGDHRLQRLISNGTESFQDDVACCGSCLVRPLATSPADLDKVKAIAGR
jgi:hypothetical protein